MCESKPVIGNCENKLWYNSSGKYHREDGPAIIYHDGTESWYINRKLHRTDGPAIYGNDGSVWLIDDIKYYNNKSFQEAAGISDEDMLLMILKYGDVK
jgi:protein associated with RNAse G/E